LYITNIENEVFNIETNRLRSDDSNPSYLWHCRLGHINMTRMKKLHEHGLLGSYNLESYDTCESCLMGKMTRSSFKGKGDRAKKPLELIHTDVCGPMSTPARGNYGYFI